MKKLFFILTFICISYNLKADLNISYHTDEVENGYDYLLYTPDSITAPKPLIIALHSRSASGKNLKDVDNFGTIDAIESGMKLNAYVLAPQANVGKWEIEKLKENINHVIKNYPIDTTRIYAIGMSMGGNGVCDLVAGCPDKIAAAIILAGGGDKSDAKNLSKVPLWVIRGLDDREEAIERTTDMVEAIQKINGARIAYSQIKGLNHRQHERLLYMPYFYTWLLSHNLNDRNRPITPVADITPKEIKNALKGLNIRESSATKRKSRRGARGHMGPRRW